jgi:hypothetical protein
MDMHHEPAHMQTMNHGSCCLVAMLAIVASAVVPSLGHAQDRMADEVVFHYRAQPFTATDLTLVPYAERQRALETARQMYDPTKHRAPTGGFSPNATVWRADRPDDFESFYKHQMNGIIAKFVAHEVLLAVSKRPSNAVVKRYYDAAALDLYVRRMAEVERSEFTASMMAVERAKDLKTFVALFQQEFPSDWGEAAYSWYYAKLNNCRPYYSLQWTCFPQVKNACVAPWYRWELERVLIGYHIRVELEQSKQEYVDILERRFGQYAGFYIRNLTAECLTPAVRLLSAIGNDDGDVACGGLRHINAILRDLGSPTEFEVCRESASEISQSYHVPLSAVQPLRMIDIGQSKSHGELHDYLYIHQQKPGRVFGEYRTSPGSFLFDVAQETILGPIVDEVVKALELSNGYSLPSRDGMIYIGVGMPFLDQRFGRPMPKVLLSEDGK